jgi:ornithine decarboxylase
MITARLHRHLNRTRPQTPILVVDLDCVEQKYRALRAALPDIPIYYAVKANPAPELIQRLASLGCHFDVASVAETRTVLETGAAAERLSFGNTIKKESDIAEAFALGVRMFAVDAEAEVRKVARAAPGARIFCRILIENTGAQWPLSRKFGCAPDRAIEVLRSAAAHGLVPFGLSFHVGSQQTDPGQWDAPIRISHEIFRTLEREGIRLQLLNLGGGFPATYRQSVPPLDVYAQQIQHSLRRHFGRAIPRLIIEPGRGLVGDAGVIETEVILIARKAADDERVWVYLDIGKFGGLAETMDEMIQYPILSQRSGPPRPVVLAGPTCDSMDILYERASYCLPEDLEVGDRLRIGSAGAYTQTYASVGFNGFAPLQAQFI